MDYKFNKPTAGFITPADIFSMVQGLQKNSGDRPPQTSSSEPKKTDTPTPGDSDKFQELLNASRKPEARSV
jgi:hypothetical protein